MMKVNKKTTILSVVVIATLLMAIIGATYAYFSATSGTEGNTELEVKTATTDLLTFSVGDPINITADQTTFANGKSSRSGLTTAKATLKANNSTNTATQYYNVYLNISDNYFSYTQNTTTPELILTVKDSNNTEITTIDGLTYYNSISDNQGTLIKGFDITNKTGLINLVSNQEITANPTKEDTWTVTVTFVNYDANQNGNVGKTFEGQIIIGKDSFTDYKVNTIKTLSTTKSGSNLTVNLALDNGTNEIDKYYYAIEEVNTIGYVEPKIMRLSNDLALSSEDFVESTSSSYTFTGISDNKSYKIIAYGIDKKNIKTNTYEYYITTDSYTLPSITNVGTSVTADSIMVTVTATKGTNNISKYYYSIDNGNTFVESTSNSYTFTGLEKSTNYRLITKVVDSNDKYSANYVMNATTASFVSFTINGTTYNAEDGMTWRNWIDTSYNNKGISFANGYVGDSIKYLKDADGNTLSTSKNIEAGQNYTYVGSNDDLPYILCNSSNAKIILNSQNSASSMGGCAAFGPVGDTVEGAVFSYGNGSISTKYVSYDDTGASPGSFYKSRGRCISDYCKIVFTGTVTNDNGDTASATFTYYLKY